MKESRVRGFLATLKWFDEKELEQNLPNMQI